MVHGSSSAHVCRTKITRSLHLRCSFFFSKQYSNLVSTPVVAIVMCNYSILALCAMIAWFHAWL
ncbi:hypothetical protein BDV38DRAFT_260174, partial [Aspergillus pseudotamarii]